MEPRLTEINANQALLYLGYKGGGIPEDVDAAIARCSRVILATARPSSRIVFTGNYKDSVEFEVPAIQRSEVSMIGHMMYVKEDFAAAIRCLKEGLIHTEGLVTQHFPLREYHKAFAFADEHPAEVVKMMIDIA